MDGGIGVRDPDGCSVGGNFEKTQIGSGRRIDQGMESVAFSVCSLWSTPCAPPPTIFESVVSQHRHPHAL